MHDCMGLVLNLFGGGSGFETLVWDCIEKWTTYCVRKQSIVYNCDIYMTKEVKYIVREK